MFAKTILLLRKILIVPLGVFAGIFSASAQKALPDFDVADNGGRIIISWKNNITKPMTSLSIQRSYDSLNNFVTIGDVLNPLAQENGYLDNNPPYLSMYYRLFIAYDGGTYTITKSKRPVDTLNLPQYRIRYAWDKSGALDSSFMAATPAIPVNINVPAPSKPGSPAVPAFPSRFAFTNREARVVFHFPDFQTKAYVTKVFDESGKPLFEFGNKKEEYLFMDKMNFPHSGTYYFEMYENGMLIEKNKFIVSRDTKSN